MPNSFAQSTTIACPKCNTSFPVDVWMIVDDSENPQLNQAILQNSLHTFVCPECKDALTIDAGLLVYQPDAEPHLVFSPPQATSNEQDRELAGSLLGVLRRSAGPAFQNEWLSQLAVIPRKALAIFLQQGPEAAEALLRGSKVEGGLLIPPEFQEEVNQIVQMTRQARNDPSLLVYRLDALQKLLVRVSREEYPAFRASLCCEMGNAYFDLPSGERSDNLHSAVICYEEALRYYTPESAPRENEMTTRSLNAAFDALKEIETP